MLAIFKIKDQQIKNQSTQVSKLNSSIF